jgi:fibronectin type 3 domain-containing protein
VDTQTVYVDNTVESGLTYHYYVKTVSDSGVESPPSNSTVVTVP